MTPMPETLKKLQQLLEEARTKRSWGSVSVEFKDGRPVLIKQSIQVKPPQSEEYPSERNTYWK